MKKLDSILKRILSLSTKGDLVTYPHCGHLYGLVDIPSAYPACLNSITKTSCKSSTIKMFQRALNSCELIKDICNDTQNNCSQCYCEAMSSIPKTIADISNSLCNGGNSACDNSVRDEIYAFCATLKTAVSKCYRKGCEEPFDIAILPCYETLVPNQEKIKPLTIPDLPA